MPIEGDDKVWANLTIFQDNSTQGGNFYLQLFQDSSQACSRYRYFFCPRDFPQDGLEFDRGQKT
jgi:hypothetical protein